MSSVKDDWEEYSVIGDKGEIGFIDFADDESVCNYDLEMDGPVIISSPFPFQRRKPRSILAGAISKCPVTIENTTAEPVELWGVKIYCSVPADSFTLSLMEPPSVVNSKDEKHGGFLEGYFLEDRVLQPHEKLTIWLSCKPKELGLHTSVVHFDVGNERIERVAFLLAEDDISQSLASSRPYARAPRRKQFVVNDFIVSSRPAVGPSNGGYKNKLPQFPIPENVRAFLESKQIPDVLKEGLKKDNYDLFFSTLLIMEELNLEKEMRLHTMEGVCMKKRGTHLLALEVPGLAEKRPSLVNGDHVFAKVAFDNSPGNTVYQGFTFRVEADEVLLRFAKEFHDGYRTGNLYDVRFTYNRVNMRRLYQAVEMAERIDRDIIFPSHSAAKRLVDGAGFAPFGSSLNEEQRHSVAMILGCKGGPPYMIYGPPGTGKTVTLVEAMLQLYATCKNARVLICAASNSAADHILEKLVTNEHVHVKDNELFRLNATSRSYDDVQPDHVPYCYFEESIFKCPPLKALSKYRIIISTYMSVSLLHAEGINRGHFSHLFLDECGQASEPECMIPIANLCQRKTVVVLAGDPQQLGPVVYCKDAEAFGLGKSFLERLFECEFYSNEDKNYVTKLVRNYRCHPAILDLPSKLFYKGELLGCKEDTSPIVCSSLNFITNKDFPVVFIGIQGCDEREGNNPSWFNRIEASKVVQVIRKLTASQDVNEKDIGVITPYRQQVLKIKKALESWDMSGIRVGSVEQFQGQEREVIIVSTVRSTVKHNDFDRTHCLGFLSNPKRFNVAITRARSLLIIIGNPHIVCQDQYWNKLLWYCVDNNSYHGCALPERQSTGLEEPPPSEKVLVVE